MEELRDKFDKEKSYTAKRILRKYEFIKSYENFDLYRHEKGFYECFDKGYRGVNK